MRLYTIFMSTGEKLNIYAYAFMLNDENAMVFYNDKNDFIAMFPSGAWVAIVDIEQSRWLPVSELCQSPDGYTVKTIIEK